MITPESSRRARQAIVAGAGSLLIAAGLAPLAGCGGCDEVVVEGATNIPASERAVIGVEYCVLSECHAGAIDTGDPPAPETQVTVGDPAQAEVGGGVFWLGRDASLWRYRFTSRMARRDGDDRKVGVRLTLHDELADAPLVRLDLVATERHREDCASFSIDAGPRAEVAP